MTLSPKLSKGGRGGGRGGGGGGGRGGGGGAGVVIIMEVEFQARGLEFVRSRW